MGNWGIFVIVLASLSTSFASASHANSVTFRALGVSQEVLLEQTVDVGGQNLGDLSQQVFSDAVTAHVLKAYQGSPEGVLSINNMGNGLEVLSKNAFNAYGWCYLIDGKSVDLLANEYTFSGTEMVVEWYYGYDQLNGTQWSSTCDPADHLPPPQTPNFIPH